MIKYLTKVHEAPKLITMDQEAPKLVTMNVRQSLQAFHL